MHGLCLLRIVVGVFTLLINVAFGLFLLLDYFRYDQNVHPESYHAPAVLTEFSAIALPVLIILLITLVELARRDKPAAATQVRFELAWMGTVIFLQYSTALMFTTMYWFAFDCKAAEQQNICHNMNMIIFIAALAIPFTSFLYFSFFLTIALRVASRDPNQPVWRTPVREVDWDGRRRTLVFDDSYSIASFSNKEEAIMTLKSNSNNTIRGTPNGNFNLDINHTHNLSEVSQKTIFPSATMTSKPTKMVQSIRQSFRNSIDGRMPRGSVTIRSDSSVYSTDSPVLQPRPIIPQIIRTSASTMTNSMQSPILALGKVKYFQATSTYD